MVSVETPLCQEASGPPSPILRIDSSSPTREHSFFAISEKLDSENYFLWCQQVEYVIKVHTLHNCRLNLQIPVKVTCLEDANHNRISPAFEAWEQQDQVLLVW